MLDGLTADEFYRLRDDRTNRVTPSRDYHRFRVRIVADPAMLETFNGQAQIIVAASMLTRWCRCVEFGFADTLLVPLLQNNRWKTLHERITDEAKQADPYGQFTFRTNHSDDIEYTLAIGGVPTDEPADFSINNEGWHVYAGVNACPPATVSPTDNPLSAAFAACVGVADAFKVATRIDRVQRVKDFAWSLLDFKEANTSEDAAIGIPATIDLGVTQLIGVGAVGSAILYLLNMLPCTGTLQLIDHDTVKIENLNRSPLFGLRDVGQYKAKAASSYMKPTLAVGTFNTTYHEFIRDNGRLPIDLLLPEANEMGVRAFVENNFPPIQIYGTTTSNWGINYHRHIPLEEDCSVCRFPQEVQQAALVCAETKIESASGEQIDAALPFLSVGAAVLATADTVKLHMVGYPFTANFVFIDFLGKLDVIAPHRRQPKEGCLCQQRSTTIHENLIASSRFIAKGKKER